MHLLTRTNRTALWSFASNSEDRSTADKEKHLCTHTWYGKLATQMSKKGSSVLRTSPMRIWSLFCIGLHWKQIFQSHWFLNSILPTVEMNVYEKHSRALDSFLKFSNKPGVQLTCNHLLIIVNKDMVLLWGKTIININPWIATYIPAINI